jgi:hypothetical protein
MSQENVEMIRSVLPGPDADLVAVFNDDSASGELMQMARLLDPDFVSVKHFPGAEPEIAHGLRWREGLIVYFKAYSHREDTLERPGRLRGRAGADQPVMALANVDRTSRLPSRSPRRWRDLQGDFRE